ncbi:MAG: repressor LexA [Candidatus Rokubacteria bacterium]|nr:repressor LexA [Candidatus Rokubacteria bacterium]
MRELTARQREILAFIRTFTQRHSVPPTVREIGERFRITPRAAFDHLRALERKGALQRRVAARRTSRALTLPDRASAVREVPILGRIAAGVPLLAEENREGTLPLLADWLAGKGRELFALRVRGESMVNAHILDGDLVLVRRQETAEPGEIVVALLDNEATVKRFGREGDAIVLKPEHPTMAPILIKPGQRDVKILGKVIGLLRGF